LILVVQQHSAATHDHGTVSPVVVLDVDAHVSALFFHSIKHRGQANLSPVDGALKKKQHRVDYLSDCKQNRGPPKWSGEPQS
jgi:hypothetical protein